MTKVMFLIAVTRPMYDANIVCIFDGKIGTWPVVEECVAKHDSINCLARMVELKGVKVTHARVIEMLTDNVLPAVKNLIAF